MSVDILLDLQQEIRRLFIAGSGLAAGDLRMKKLLPQLQALGESAPVFKRVAASVQQTIEPSSEDTTTPLLELGSLLQSILHTQGKTDPTNSSVEFAVADVVQANQIPYRKLKPLLDALTQKGPGRFEIINQAYNERIFTDYRTMLPAIEALDESYVDIADFLVKTVVPAYGVPALPILQKQLQLQGGKGDARRLQLIHNLLGAEGQELYLQAVEQGSLEVRIGAIELLSHYPELESILLEQSHEKRKEIRRAALFALAKLQSAAALERLYEAITGKDYDIAIEPIQKCRVASLTERILQYADKQFENILNGETKGDSPAHLLAALKCFEGDPEPMVFGFLRKLLTNDVFMFPKYSLLQDCAAQLLLDLKSVEANEFAMTLHHTWNSHFIGYSFKAAMRVLSPEELYNQYSGDLKDKLESKAKEILRIFDLLTRHVSSYESDSNHLTRSQNWDPRWIQLFMHIDEEELVCRFVQAPDKKVISYLKKQLEIEPNINKGRTLSFLNALYKLEYKNTPLLLMDILEKSSARQIYHLNAVQMNLLLNLPNTYSERLKRFSEKLTYETVKKQVLEIVDVLEKRLSDNEPDEKGEGLLKWIKNKMF